MFAVPTSLTFVFAVVAGLATAETINSVDSFEPVETHCVVFVVDQKPDGELVTTEPACFQVKADAEAWAQAWLSMVSSEPTDESSGGVEVSSYTLGTHYDGANGSGSSISVVGSSCTGGYWNTPNTWDNRISSSYNGCVRLRHWDLPNKAGASQNTYGAGAIHNLTTMDNRTESVSYHSS